MNPQLNIPEGVRSKIFKAFSKHLQEDPILSNCIRTWDDYSGTAQDFAVVPLEQCPAIRLTISTAPMAPETYVSHSASFSINIEVIAAGTNQFDMINLWEAVEVACLPFLEGDNRIIKVLGGDRRVVFGTHYFSSTAINHAKYSNPPCMVGTGSLTFVLALRR